MRAVGAVAERSQLVDAVYIYIYMAGDLRAELTRAVMGHGVVEMGGRVVSREETWKLRDGRMSKLSQNFNEYI